MKSANPSPLGIGPMGAPKPNVDKTFTGAEISIFDKNDMGFLLHQKLEWMAISIKTAASEKITTLSALSKVSLYLFGVAAFQISVPTTIKTTTTRSTKPSGLLESIDYLSFVGGMLAR